jgi:hypothetical protein
MPASQVHGGPATAGVLSRDSVELLGTKRGAVERRYLFCLKLPSVRTRPQFQLILGARDIMSTDEDIPDKLLRLITEITHKFPIHPAIVARDEQQFDVARMTKPAQQIHSTFDELTAQVPHLPQIVGAA